MRPPLLLALASLWLTAGCTEITNCPDAENGQLTSDSGRCGSTAVLTDIGGARDEVAAWSADGAAILYTKIDAGQVVIAERQVSSGGERILGAVPSPTSGFAQVERIVAGADGRGVFVVRRFSGVTSTLFLLTTTADTVRLIMSVDAVGASMVGLRDGGLAFVSAGSLFVTPPASAQASLVASDCAAVRALSPDGTEVLCERGSGLLVAVMLASGAQRSIAGQGGQHVIWTTEGIVAIDTDGRRAIGTDLPPITLTWRRVDGTVSSPTLTLREGALGGQVALSADGRLLGLRADRCDGASSSTSFCTSSTTRSEFRVIDTRTHGERAGFGHTYLPPRLNGDAMYFSRDGKQVAYFTPGLGEPTPGTLHVRSID